MKQETIDRIRKFREDRDWDQFHSPANLAKSIVIEASELLECFQWSDNYNLDKVNAFSDKNNLKEMKDVKRLILILEFFIFYVSKEDNNIIKSTNNANDDWIQKYLKLKDKYENDNNINEDNIIEFFKKKPENGLKSIKLFLIPELMKNKE